jgi:hypothetical protein
MIFFLVFLRATPLWRDDAKYRAQRLIDDRKKKTKVRWRCWWRRRNFGAYSKTARLSFFPPPPFWLLVHREPSGFFFVIPTSRQCFWIGGRREGEFNFNLKWPISNPPHPPPPPPDEFLKASFHLNKRISRVEQWELDGPITHRSVDRNHPLLTFFKTLPFQHRIPLLLRWRGGAWRRRGFVRFLPQQRPRGQTKRHRKEKIGCKTPSPSPPKVSVVMRTFANGTDSFFYVLMRGGGISISLEAALFVAWMCCRPNRVWWTLPVGTGIAWMDRDLRAGEAALTKVGATKPRGGGWV